ncbi:hypothetical protein JG687_00016128 [Phytophthora cactorum]|uniref:Uncharacterized protein n=1 Tax=Phytophthora cactorum TaxID=29920 RepID=A0A8T1TSX8_9STRA|nr:hypothetical protein JG687_00016128 [Phytophthora cactorum]
MIQSKWRNVGGDLPAHTTKGPASQHPEKNKQTKQFIRGTGLSRDESKGFVAKSTKARKRPKIRNNQVQDVKRQRMNEARKEVKQLVQGTLLPVVTLSGILRLLQSNYSYESGYGILSNFLLILWDPGSKPLQGNHAT